MVVLLPLLLPLLPTALVLHHWQKEASSEAGFDEAAPEQDSDEYDTLEKDAALAKVIFEKEAT